MHPDGSALEFGIGGVAKAKAYKWRIEHFATRRNAADRTFCNVINKKRQAFAGTPTVNAYF
jgi:hypothetical protein